MTTQKFQPKKLAKAVLDKRIKDDLSFRQIQKSVKGSFTSSTLQKIEACNMNPSAETLAAVCNWLNVPVQTFFN